MMTPKRYLVLCVLAMSLLAAGCGTSSTSTTPEPFTRFRAQDVLDALTKAGLSVVNPQRSLAIRPGPPLTYNDRYTFEIVVRNVPPGGGQLLIFTTPGAMQRWQAYIATQKADSSTRRDWLFVYTYKNVLLQINPNLTNDEADKYRKALESMR